MQSRRTPETRILVAHELAWALASVGFCLLLILSIGALGAGLWSRFGA